MQISNTGMNSSFKGWIHFDRGGCLNTNHIVAYGIDPYNCDYTIIQGSNGEKYRVSEELPQIGACIDVAERQRDAYSGARLDLLS